MSENTIKSFDLTRLLRYVKSLRGILMKGTSNKFQQLHSLTTISASELGNWLQITLVSQKSTSYRNKKKEVAVVHKQVYPKTIFTH